MKSTFEHIKCTTRRYTVFSLIIFAFVLNAGFFGIQIREEYHDLGPLEVTLGDGSQSVEAYDKSYYMFSNQDETAIQLLEKSNRFGIVRFDGVWHIIKPYDDKILMKSLQQLITKQKVLAWASLFGLIIVVAGYLVLLEKMQKQITSTIYRLLAAIRNLRPEKPGQQLIVEGLHCNDELHEVVAAVNAKSIQVQAYIDHLKRLIGFIQHEFNTPLTAAMLRLERIEKKGSSPEDIQKMKDNLSHLSELVFSLSQLTQLQVTELRTQQVDLVPLVMSCVQDLQLAHPDHTIKISSPAKLVLNSNSDYIEIIVRNLIDNACKYSKPETTVEVIIDKNRLMVADQGIGIPSEKMSEIWLPFWQADQSRSADNGFGLGLALVRELCAALSWSIDCRSVEGKGTTFIINWTDTDVADMSHGR